MFLSFGCLYLGILGFKSERYTCIRKLLFFIYVWVPEVGNTADTPNFTPVGFEPTTSGLDLPMLYQLSYEVSMGAGLGNLGSESRLTFK